MNARGCLLRIVISLLSVAESPRMMYNIIKYRLIVQLEGEFKMASTVNTNVINLELSSEQNEFITKALDGKNILVDACIGSGKTTAIQQANSLFDLQPPVEAGCPGKN